LYIKCCSFPQEVPQKTLNLLSINVIRIFHHQKAHKQDQLLHVLIPFCVCRPDIRYCQGMDFLVFLLLPIAGEGNAFYLFPQIATDFRPQD
jgi:hypothetical protein